ncbi:hypothetical protein [Pseudoalteromonas luteoviolacea]|uniref:Alginate lyase 2 domain-containing protein n=1 Tax=Pseudoalteromonas luteoviolacea H33 TaxID=1365251 RepID=A0A167ACE2_9GAMM|nr:hypothetical protein [Pseudoalteromonas luteoviolacea]KZN45221.1 hypothetical protein N476_04220 [Pseudoalteromonas luteoviolacea H33]KZN70915.1 hypothetical protein N477_05820 [Pseudoalteromonas luteoviolacea H33-S]MBQ4877245.1 hypothetical protein [Pseudoalteromonas luteoviolacea]MBQ4906106.1 hypothetical protein [Pseudoalteromonas luteoviolacea]
MKYFTHAVMIMGILSALNTTASANEPQNSAIRVLIDDQGTPYIHKDDAFDPWQITPLPYYQKTVAASGGYFHHRPSSESSPGYAYNEGATFAVGEYGMVFRYQNDTWQHVFGCLGAADVSTYSPKHAYCVTQTGDLKKFNLVAEKFGGNYGIPNKRIVKIDVNETGAVWAITDDNELYQRNNGNWHQININCPQTCTLKDVAVGGGEVYVTAHIFKNTRGSQQVYKLNGDELEKFGHFYNIDVDRDNTIWTISYDSKTLHYKRPGMIDFVEEQRVNHATVVDIGG